MLRPASVNSLLSQLIAVDAHDATGRTIKPHTALLTLLDSSELYAFATRLSESRARASTTSVVSSSSISTPPLSLDERATCLSAIAVAAWRNNTGTAPGSSFVAGPGMKVSVSKHHASNFGSALDGKRGQSQDYIPLMLECDLGRMLIMPIIPVQPQSTPSRAELASPERDPESSAAGIQIQEGQHPFMLLILNADLTASQVDVPAPTPPTRSRFRSGGLTPTSQTSSGAATATNARSPVSENGPTRENDQQGDGAGTNGADDNDVNRASDEEDEYVWATMYAQAKALARLLAPSLAKCGVGSNGLHDDDNGDGRRSSQVLSEDEHDE